jgi:hypothetical protein
MPVHAPKELTVSGRVLVATFLLPFEATIDLEEGRTWVMTRPPMILTDRTFPPEEAIPRCTLPYAISARIQTLIQN